jgi:hypothetical protein
MITLAVESPNQSCECWHTGDTSGYADFLAGLIENQLGKYPVSELWLSGFSSGAQEITRFLVPRHPELMRLGGGWVVFGGGGPPADGGSAVTAARMAGVRGHWFTGTADTAVPLTASWGAQAGERFYAGRGVVTSSEYPSGVGHALDGRLGPTVARADRRLVTRREALPAGAPPAACGSADAAGLQDPVDQVLGEVGADVGRHRQPAVGVPVRRGLGCGPTTPTAPRPNGATTAAGSPLS